MPCGALITLVGVLKIHHCPRIRFYMYYIVQIFMRVVKFKILIVFRKDINEMRIEMAHDSEIILAVNLVGCFMFTFYCLLKGTKNFTNYCS